MTESKIDFAEVIGNKFLTEIIALLNNSEFDPVPYESLRSLAYWNGLLKTMEMFFRGTEFNFHDYRKLAVDAIFKLLSRYSKANLSIAG